MYNLINHFFKKVRLVAVRINALGFRIIFAKDGDDVRQLRDGVSLGVLNVFG